MRRSAERTDIGCKPKVAGTGDQAGPPHRRYAALAVGLPLLALVAGCGSASEANPRSWWSNLTGGYLAGRELPPGLDEPYPNLGTVPPRPARPDPATREAISAALAAERERSRSPLTPGGGAADSVFIAPAAPGGDRSLGLPGPPPPPSLAAAPRIPWVDPSTTTPAPRPPEAAGPPARPEGQGPAAAPPPAPPPDLLGPPPAPPGELLAPSAAPPGAPPLSGPPPAPPSDLLAPPPATSTTPRGG